MAVTEVVVRREVAARPEAVVETEAVVDEEVDAVVLLAQRVDRE